MNSSVFEYNMVFWRLVLLLITLVSIFLEQSSARPVHQGQNQVAPSPSPVAAANANLGTNQVPVGQPMAPFVSGTCAGASNKCQDDHVSMIACYFPAQKGHEEPYLLILNNGENTLTLKVNVSSANTTFENIQIPKHDSKQINISSKLRGSSSIILDAGTGKCTIDIGRSVWQGYINFPSYTMYVTPTNGAYLLGVSALLIGGIFICCKLRKQDGVAYQELEMGQPEPHSSMKLEISAEGWNESWDDDWGDEKAVNSPGRKTISVKLANDFDHSDKSLT